MRGKQRKRSTFVLKSYIYDAPRWAAIHNLRRVGEGEKLLINKMFKIPEIGNDFMYFEGHKVVSSIPQLLHSDF